jgi:phenylalanyl-tRNA synthetase alpha chain
MQDKIKSFLEKIKGVSIQTPEEAESFRLKYLSKKGIITGLFDEFKTLPPELRKSTGKILNELKQAAEQKLADAKEIISANNYPLSTLNSQLDLSLPADPFALGSKHPISIVRKQMMDIFTRIGFVVSDGPEIEDDWHNFGALNFPEDHPARDMQDTFFIQSEGTEKWLLRTHTSSVQVRVMENQKPPIRTISPGRVYRNETISARAHCQFHQVEGLYIDEGVSFADLKQTLYYFVQEMFGESPNPSQGEKGIRFRPSFFPFTEPSAEMDITCLICEGKGCPVCKHSGWVEIMGCGMVHPNVLDNCKIDSSKYTGYAFGMGIERIAMLKFRVNDLRLFFENDMRFLSQFKSIV